MKEPLLEIKNLVTEFRTEEGVIKAVNGVNVLLHKGETVGIVGESGSGKSVTALSCMRLIQSPPGHIVNGEVLYHGRGEKTNLLALSDKHMRSYRGNDLAMIFQEPMTSLNPVFRCGHQVSEAIRLHEKLGRKAAKAKTLQLFKEVQLPDPERIYKAYPHEISGGQKQRVMIAMAMSCNPSVLIADEPTTALDVTVQKTILELMKGLQQKHKMGILFITHDLGVISELADRIVVMYKGKVVEEGPVNEIFLNPQHPYTKGLLACRPPLNKRLSKLPTIAEFMTVNQDGTIEEKSRDIKGLVNDFEISMSDREKRHETIYDQKPILEVRNLSTHFVHETNFIGKPKSFIKAVDDVSFDVYPGEVLGLVGESGCGKTTLGRTILKLIEPTAGRIIYNGTDITHYSTAEMRPLRTDLQIIFQDPYSSLNPRITIGNAILEPMQVHGMYRNKQERYERVMELLGKVGLSPNHYNRYPHEFSGGQRQRIGIARTLALNPKFIICDESVSALDVSVQAQVLNLLNSLKAEFGFTYIFISHDLSVVKFMSDRMIVMNKGKIEEMGAADAIYQAPKTQYTQLLIDAIPKGIVG